MAEGIGREIQRHSPHLMKISTAYSSLEYSNTEPAAQFSGMGCFSVEPKGECSAGRWKNISSDEGSLVDLTLTPLPKAGKYLAISPTLDFSRIHWNRLNCFSTLSKKVS